MDHTPQLNQHKARQRVYSRQKNKSASIIFFRSPIPFLFEITLLAYLYIEDIQCAHIGEVAILTFSRHTTLTEIPRKKHSHYWFGGDDNTPSRIIGFVGSSITTFRITLGRKVSVVVRTKSTRNYTLLVFSSYLGHSDSDGEGNTGHVKDACG